MKRVIRKLYKWSLRDSHIAFAIFLILVVIFLITLLTWAYDAATLMLIVLIIIFIVTFNRLKHTDKFVKYIENWTIIVKETKIKQIVFYQDRDEEWHTISWYYLITWCWNEEFKSKLYQNAYMAWSEKLENNRKYDDYWITFYPNDREWILKQINQKMKLLENEYNYTWDKTEQKRIKKEYQNLYEFKLSILPPHLEIPNVVEECIKPYCIGDTIKVYISPENKKDYYLDL
jgi:hypothetical protein